MTVLELIVVLALIGLLMWVGYSSLRWIRKSQLVEDTTRLARTLERTGQLSTESGLIHRVILDLDKQTWTVEACQGGGGLRRSNGEDGQPISADERERRLAEAKSRLATLPPGVMPPAGGSSEDPTGEADRLAALAGLGGMPACVPVADVWTGNAEGKTLAHGLDPEHGIKIREVWVQHLDESVTAGQVSLSFFPLGWAEKAIIEVADADGNAFSVLIFGLTGRVEILDAKVEQPNDHMMRNADGTDEEER